MIAERHAKLEAGIKPVAVHFANVVIHAARAQHWAGDAGIDCQFGGKFADVLGASDDDLI